MLGWRTAIGLAVLSAGVDPSELVGRLGAARYADRESASIALELLGADALPALRKAKAGRDAEVRARASELLLTIENDLLVKPTMIRLDFRGRPVGEILSALSTRGASDLSLADSDPSVASRRIDLASPEPVGFWESIGRLEEAASLELCDTTPSRSPVEPGATGIPLRLMGLPRGGRRAPTTTSGAFRITLVGLSRHRERRFGGDSDAGFGFRNGAGLQDRIPNVDAQGRRIPVGDEFVASLTIQAEPRMNVSLAGPIRLAEAVDEEGSSLIAEGSSSPVFLHRSAPNRADGGGLSTISADVPLRYPDHGGRAIRRMRGSAPVTISARKAEPHSIPLADAAGRTIHGTEASLTVIGVSVPDGAALSLDLGLRFLQPDTGSGQEFALIRGSNHPENQIDVVDDQSRVYPHWFATSQSQTADGLRATIRVSPAPGLGPPARLVFHDLARVPTDVEFEFRDVEMP